MGAEMTSSVRFLGLAGVALAMSGCLTVASFQTADTNGRGRTQLGLEAGSTGIAVKDGRASLPGTAISARYGVSDDLDIGARIGTGGGDIMAKLRLMGGPGQLTVSLAPSIGGISLGPTSLTSAQVPLLVGIPLGSHQFVLSPKVHMYRASIDTTTTDDKGVTTYAAASATILSAGTGVGLALKLGETFRILPEFSVVYPLYLGASAVAGSQSTSDSMSLVNVNGAIYQVGVALLFGGPMANSNAMPVQ
jgi:hypothetical protein